MASLLLTVSFLFATLSSKYLVGLSLNPVDSCWRGNPNWASSRHALANCAVGFGKAAIGGKHGPIYVVTNPSDDPRHPKPESLRYGAIQSKPLWITFARDMVIVLKYELLVSSYKTIDGRGAKVEITNGPCITLKRVSHVIIHGISFHGCRTGLVRRGSWDGDAIRVFQSTHVWIDHCSFARCQDGLVDVIHSSTAVTITNSHFTHHEKVSTYMYIFVIRFLMIESMILSFHS
ncbi:unnamed protein product [Microthlaspi erraticum]|uniref:Pectate lyase n=1 Tax=Microthlaspi erraticum TaxID=1685480 RepID=A0A6D2KSR5_9BRAS|nr:unnamed protein product [Microthlaspi erraticum]